jgi:hypothetical protein
VHYGLRIRCSVDTVSMRVLDRLHVRLREVSQILWEASPGSSFWRSLTENPLTIDVAGWRFQYTISREANRIDVIEAARISDVLPAPAGDGVRRKRGA